MTMGAAAKRSPREAMLDNILAISEGMCFSKKVSAGIVGGSRRLETLISEGRIDAWQEQPVRKNSKWFCNARQVWENARLVRK